MMTITIHHDTDNPHGVGTDWAVAARKARATECPPWCDPHECGGDSDHYGHGIEAAGLEGPLLVRCARYDSPDDLGDEVGTPFIQIATDSTALYGIDEAHQLQELHLGRVAMETQTENVAELIAALVRVASDADGRSYIDVIAEVALLLANGRADDARGRWYIRQSAVDVFLDPDEETFDSRRRADTVTPSGDGQPPAR